MGDPGITVQNPPDSAKGVVMTPVRLRRCSTIAFTMRQVPARLSPKVSLLVVSQLDT